MANLKVQPDKTAEFEAVFRELIDKVRATEPNTLVYQLMRSRTESNVYKIVEVYRTDADLETHKAAEPFTTLFPKIIPLLAEKPTADMMEALG